MAELVRSARAMTLLLVMTYTHGAAAQTNLPGVAGVSFGKAHRYKGPGGKEMCGIVEPAPLPAIFRGVTEISYGVHLQARIVKSASTQVIAPAGQQPLVREPCNAFMLVPGGVSQTLLGSTISRADKKPLQPGTYTVRITVDGQTQDVLFEVRPATRDH